MHEDRIQKIVIVGGGTAGWMVAAALSKVLGRDYARITLVESDAIGTIGVGEATIPQINIFNRLLGIDENEFVRRTKGTFKLGIQFVNWAREGHVYFHPFGKYGVDMNGVSFHAFWLRMRQAGLAPDINAYSLAAQAAMDGKFMRPVNAGHSPLSQIAYAFHFDAGLYAAYLREKAEAAGVIRQEGRIVDVVQDGDSGFVTAVELEDGSTVPGELFIDCSGFRGLLIADKLGVPFRDWSHWLPCNSAVTVPCARSETTPPFTRSTARDAGWQWRIPLQHRIGNGYVYCDKYIDHDAAKATLLANLDGEPMAEPRLIRFTTGIRERAWEKNVVAVGLASGFMEPLESTSIHMVQSAIAHLLSNFTDRNFDPACIARYNRIVTTEAEEIRDFLILHYKATERTDTPFWTYCRDMDIPDRLAEKIRVFESAGRCFRENEELFNDTSWFAVMTGQLLKPRTYDPVANMVGEAETRRRLEDILSAIRHSADYMPRHDDFIRENCAAMG